LNLLSFMLENLTHRPKISFLGVWLPQFRGTAFMPPKGISSKEYQGWQVSANRGLNRPGRNRFLTVFTKHGTTTAAVR